MKQKLCCQIHKDLICCTCGLVICEDCYNLCGPATTNKAAFHLEIRSQERWCPQCLEKRKLTVNWLDYNYCKGCWTGKIFGCFKFPLKDKDRPKWAKKKKTWK